MFFLDIKPEKAYRRIRQSREKREIFENIEELEKIRFKAISLALTGKWKTINANHSVSEIEKEVIQSLPF